jgi:predicted kinase
MRKWMKDRLQRRKKKTPEQGSQPVPPPLQPAYFDAEEAPGSPDDSSHRDSSSTEDGRHESDRYQSDRPQQDLTNAVVPTAEREFEASPAVDEAASGVQQTRTPAAGGDSQRARGRRRRGGRGRGGRGREQAVAQAFSPAAGKGIIPDRTASEEALEAGALEADAPDSSASETAEPEAQAAPRTPQVPAAVPVAAARPPKGIVVLAIGLPGSGKSSWFKRHSVVPLSSDMVRSLLFDDVREQRFQDLVFSNLRSMLKARLIAKRPMNYVDATNLTPQERQHWIKLAKDYNYEVHAVFFDVPLEVCLERHQRRDRVVPEDIMRRMAAKLKAPSFEEGFAKITVVRVKKKE